MNNCYIELCTGCGLCHDQMNVDFTMNNQGYELPSALTVEQNKFCDQICPMGRNGINHDRCVKSLWGNYLSIHSGYSTNDIIRYRASSGGMITGLAVYLLEKNLVDGIIQIRADPSVPYHTEVVCNYKPEDVIRCCGSRYSQSSLLGDISKLIKPNEKYAFIGKPCDVRALRNLMNIKGIFSDNILYLLSFFCAGTPTDRANIKLLNALGCTKDHCVELCYRGNGWPGRTFAIDSTGKKCSMEYEVSWMNILGRDIRKSCRFCFDGIGEAADVSAGDFWNLDKNNKPDFCEDDGQNVVFSWTETGSDLLRNAQKDNSIILFSDNDIETKLNYCQPNHKMKRSTTYAKVLALKIFGKSYPYFDTATLRKYGKFSSLKNKFQAFKGTVRRIIDHRL